jgi:hypothetical protein
MRKKLNQAQVDDEVQVDEVEVDDERECQP